MRSGHQRFGLFGQVFAIAWLACVALPAIGQVYTFTSGPSGDGFDWPASPPGLIDGEYVSTPDGVEIYNDTGNSLFFDQQYQVVGNGSRISGDALWGNPLDIGSGFVPVIALDFSGLESEGLQDLGFNFAWSQSGVSAVSDFVSFYAEDSEGRSTFGSWTLNDTFIGFGGSTGYEDTVSLSASLFTDDENNVDGGSFIDIARIDIFLDEIVTVAGGPSSEFAIDNFSLDGSVGGGGDLYPSVNQGQNDVTGVILGGSSLRGTGTFARGIEVTNGGATSTTYSTELVPGGDLTSGTHPNGAFINGGQSIFTPGVATIDRSLPTGAYQSDIRIINDGNPADPDNVSTLRISLYNPQSLSGNFANVNVGSEQITLANAAAAPSGFRASVKVTGSQTSGPFQVTDFAVDTAVKPGESAQTAAAFIRYGQLSGTRTGTHTVSLQQTAIVGTNDIEISLANTETVPDQVWNLSFNHVDATSDNANISTGFSYFHILGVNTFDVAATLIDGTSSNNQNVSMQITTDPDPTSANLIGEPVDLIFGGGAGDQYVLQLTYNDGALPSGVTESQLQLLVYDTVAGEWEAAVDGNTTGSSTLFNGSYADYLAGPGGGVFDAGDLGFFGVDTVNNHVWAVLDHASLFAVGVLSAGTLGDFDGDGDVDGADFLVWQRDPNVWNLSDWQNAYGSGGGTGVVTVPEPTSLTIVFACLMISIGSRAVLTR